MIDAIAKVASETIHDVILDFSVLAETIKKVAAVITASTATTTTTPPPVTNTKGCLGVVKNPPISTTKTNRATSINSTRNIFSVIRAALELRDEEREYQREQNTRNKTNINNNTAIGDERKKTAVVVVNRGDYNYRCDVARVDQQLLSRLLQGFTITGGNQATVNNIKQQKQSRQRNDEDINNKNNNNDNDNTDVDDNIIANNDTREKSADDTNANNDVNANTDGNANNNAKTDDESRSSSSEPILHSRMEPQFHVWQSSVESNASEIGSTQASSNNDRLSQNTTKSKPNNRHNHKNDDNNSDNESSNTEGLVLSEGIGTMDYDSTDSDKLLSFGIHSDDPVSQYTNTSNEQQT